MAGITFNGTQVLISPKQLPTGYTKPVVAAVTGLEYQSMNKVVSITKSLVEDASDATTFTNIIADAVNGLNKKILDLLTNDLDIVANTVTSYAVLKNVTINQVFGDALYTNATPVYLCDVVIYIRMS
jgi:hypothetical protein